MFATTTAASERDERRLTRANIIKLLETSKSEMLQNVILDNLPNTTIRDKMYFESLIQIYEIFIDALKLLNMPSGLMKGVTMAKFATLSLFSLRNLYKKLKLQRNFDFGPAQATVLNCNIKIFAYINLRLFIPIVAIHICDDYKLSRCFTEDGRIAAAIRKGVIEVSDVSDYPSEPRTVAQLLVYQCRAVLLNFSSFLNINEANDSNGGNAVIKEIYRQLQSQQDTQALYIASQTKATQIEYTPFYPLAIIEALRKNPAIMPITFPNMAVCTYYNKIANDLGIIAPEFNSSSSDGGNENDNRRNSLLSQLSDQTDASYHTAVTAIFNPFPPDQMGEGESYGERLFAPREKKIPPITHSSIQIPKAPSPAGIATPPPSRQRPKTPESIRRFAASLSSDDFSDPYAEQRIRELRQDLAMGDVHPDMMDLLLH